MLVIAALVAVLGACDGNNSPQSDHSGHSDHNGADVTFAQQMIPHHSQALDMARMVGAGGAGAKVTDLAKRIEGAQDPEIKLMTGWLNSWGASVPTAMPGMPGMNHGTSVPGMMNDLDMKQLAKAKGAEFDKLWLQLMIAHHQGAIDMSKTELSQGNNANAKQLAQRIIDAQQAEITEMQGLLKAS